MAVNANLSIFVSTTPPMNRISFAFCCLILLYTGNSAFCGGFQINTQSQKATGMGGSLTAAALDASVTFFNPGGMVFLPQNSVLAGATAIIPKTGYLSALSGKQTDMESQLFVPFHLYGSFKIGEKLGAGLSINTPYGLGTKWNKDWEGRYISQEAKLTSIYFQPTISYKVSEKLGIGAGFVYAIGNASLQKAVPVQGASTNYGIAELKGNTGSIGFNAGVHIKFTEKVSAGISYRSKIKLNVTDGEATFSDIPSSLTSQFPASTTFKTVINLPSVLSVAGAYRVNEDLLVHLETNLTGWSSYDSLNFSFSDEYSSLNSSGKNARQYKDAVAVRLGVQYAFTKKIDVRASAAIDQSPVKDGYVTPDLPDANKYAFALGFTYKFAEKLHVDVSYLFETLNERQDVNKQTMFGGSYKTYIHAVGLGINYNF